MELAELQALERRYLMQTYRRAPVEFVRGEGALLWDSEGKEYLDFLAGISVCSVGHCHPDVVAAVREQAGRLMHVSNLFYTEPMVRLAERLSESSLGGNVFLCNSGTEATECAIKVARKHAHRRGVESAEIVSFERDFHGRTYGALSATPKLAENEALGPMLPGFRSVPLNDVGALRDAVYEDTAAVLIEPIQGESGVYPVSDEAMLAARQACDEAGRAADPRRDPDRDRADRLALGLRADPRAPGPDHHRQGARRRPARSAPASRRRRPARCWSRATTARPSPAARSPRPRRLPCSTWSTSRRCCAGCASWAPRCARACWRSTGSRRCAAAA